MAKTPRKPHPGWKEKQAKLKRFFYTLGVLEHGRYNVPYVTVCLLIDPEEKVITRGVSICHPLDCPNKKKGRLKASAWAEKAMFHKKNITANPSNKVVMDRLVAAIDQCDDQELKTDFKHTPWFVILGYYLGPLGTEDPVVRPTSKEMAMIARALAQRGITEGFLQTISDVYLNPT